MGLVGLGGGLLVGGLLTRKGVLTALGLTSWAAFGLSTLPFVRKTWPKDRTVALAAPFLLFVRAWALGLGFAVGMLRWARRLPG